MFKSILHFLSKSCTVKMKLQRMADYLHEYGWGSSSLGSIKLVAGCGENGDWFGCTFGANLSNSGQWIYFPLGWSLSSGSGGGKC